MPEKKKRSTAIYISRTHSMDIEEARQVVNQIAKELSDDLNITYYWENNRLVFRRLGINGYIEIADSEIRIKIDKSFFVPVSDAWIREHVEAHLDQHIK